MAMNHYSAMVPVAVEIESEKLNSIFDEVYSHYDDEEIDHHVIINGEEVEVWPVGKGWWCTFDGGEPDFIKGDRVDSTCTLLKGSLVVEVFLDDFGGVTLTAESETPIIEFGADLGIGLPPIKRDFIVSVHI